VTANNWHDLFIGISAYGVAQLVGWFWLHRPARQAAAKAHLARIRRIARIGMTSNGVGDYDRFWAIDLEAQDLEKTL
jgi:hypothetical protein